MHISFFKKMLLILRQNKNMLILELFGVGGAVPPQMKTQMLLHTKIGNLYSLSDSIISLLENDISFPIFHGKFHEKCSFLFKCRNYTSLICKDQYSKTEIHIVSSLQLSTLCSTNMSEWHISHTCTSHSLTLSA